MPQPKKPAAAPRASRPRKPSLPPLPPITVARLQEALALVEQLVDEQTDVFVAAGHQYRERHREGTERRLNPQEAAQIASAMANVDGLPPVTLAEAVQQSELRAYDEPEPMELLMRAGAATAPAFMQAVQRFVALVEMPPDQFKDARESEALDDALDAAVKAMAYDEVDGATGARERAQRALDHFAKASGATSGKALSLLPRALWQVIEQASSALGLQKPPKSLTGSPPSMGGDAETSSTTSSTPTP